MKTLAIFILVVAVCLGFLNMFTLIQELVNLVAIQQEVIAMHTDMIDEIYEGINMITGHLETMREEVARHVY